MPNIKFTTFLALVLVMFVTVIGVMGTYYMERYESIQRHSKSLLIERAFNQLTFNTREYHNIRDQFASVTQLLSRSQGLYSYISHQEEQDKHLMEYTWGSVLINQKWFRSIRFIDITGKEKIRVNYSFIDKKVNVPDRYSDNLNQSQLEQFSDLKPDDLHIGKLYLLPKPDKGNSDSFTPIFGLVSPVIFEGVRAGYLVLDVDLTYLMSKLNYSPSSRFKPSFLNQDGYFVDSPVPEWRFGHLIPSRKQYNFANMFPETWKLMRQEDHAFLDENNHLLVYSRVFVPPAGQYYLMIMFSDEDIQSLSAIGISQMTSEAMIVFFVAVLLALLSVFLGFYAHKKDIDSKLAQAALDGSSAMILSDQSHRVLMVNKAFENMTSLTQRVVRGKNPLKLLLSHYGIEFILDISERLVDQHLWEGEVELTNSLGLPIIVWMRIKAVEKHGSISYYIISLMDISERKELENRLRDLSERDSLTGLWNRGKFEAELQTQCKLVERYPENHPVCLAIIDIDHFKRINDQKGHDQGDLVIVGIGDTLAGVSRSTDFVARIGGEEYGMILPHTNLDDAEHFLRRLCHHVEINPDLAVTISAGVTDLSSDPRRSYKCADIALYEAKTQGRNQVCICKNGDDIA